MNKEQQIEEIMQVIFDYVDSKGMKNVYIVGNGLASDMKSYFHNFGVAEALYNAGYRKIPDGGCVLNKEENQNFIKFVRGEKKNIRKATAQDFAEKLKAGLKSAEVYLYESCSDWDWRGYYKEQTDDLIDELLKGYEE